MEDGVSVTAEDIVGKLNTVLQQNSKIIAREKQKADKQQQTTAAS